MSFDLVVTLVWTVLSFAAVLLARYGTRISRNEADDTEQELKAQRDRITPNGILVLALQQASQSRFLMWVNRGAYFHQILFFSVGILSMYSLLFGIGSPAPPTTGLKFLREMYAPLALLTAQFVIVAMQVALIYITRGQRQARFRLAALEKDDADVKAQLFTEMAEQLGSIREDQKEEYKASRIERGKAGKARAAATAESDEAHTARDAAEVESGEAGEARDAAEVEQGEAHTARYAADVDQKGGVRHRNLDGRETELDSREADMKVREDEVTEREKEEDASGND